MNLSKLTSFLLIATYACVDAHAYSCDTHKTLEEYVNYADSIFVGEVIEVETEFYDPVDVYSYYEIITFKIYLQFKGIEETQKQLYLSRHLFLNDGIGNFEIGKTWIVFSQIRRNSMERQHPEIQEKIYPCSLTGNIGYNPGSIEVMIQYDYLPGELVEPVINYPIEVLELSSKAFYNEMLHIVYSEFYPWIYHYNLGWIYIFEDSNGLCGYQEDLGCFYTNQEVFPYMYLVDGNEWVLYYDIKSYENKIWIYKFTTSDWISYSAKREWFNFW